MHVIVEFIRIRETDGARAVLARFPIVADVLRDARERAEDLLKTTAFLQVPDGYRILEATEIELFAWRRGAPRLVRSTAMLDLRYLAPNLCWPDRPPQLALVSGGVALGLAKIRRAFDEFKPRDILNPLAAAAAIAAYGFYLRLW